MGHTRLGRLPKTLNWREVVALLDQSDVTSAQIAAATTEAAARRLRALASDPALSYAIWLLARVTAAARTTSFGEALDRLGVGSSAADTPLSLVTALGDRVRAELANEPTANHYGEISVQALRQTLIETVGRESSSLFGGGREDVQRAVRTYSSEARFAEIARRFFSAFVSKSLRSIVDRELVNHVGNQTGVSSPSESHEFLRELDRHVWQSSRIIEDFAGGWYSKRNWLSNNDIARDDTRKFVGVVLRKLRSEVETGAES